MFKTYVRPDGTIQLGVEAATRYRPGTLVNVLVTRAGSIIISVNEDPPPLDATFRALEGGQAQLALKRGHGR